MKNVLQRLLLISAIALVAIGANAHVITECWVTTTDIPGSASGGEFRFASAKDGKIITIDKANKKIMAIDNNGMTELFDLAEAIEAYYGADTGAGTGITVDDAGNILVGTNFPNASSATDMIIISADLQNTYKLQITLPKDVLAGRIDQYGKVVGNMLSPEGAYLWLAITANTKVAVVKIANGIQVQDYSQASLSVKVAMNSSTLALPALWSVAEIDALVDGGKGLSTTFWSRNRGSSQNVYGWNEAGSEQVILALTEKSVSGATTKGAGAEGFATFSIAGVTYFVVPMSSEGATRSNIIGIYDELGQLCATYGPEELQTGMGQMGSIIVETCDDYSVNIYRFIPGTVAYKCNFYDVASGVEKVEIEDNAEVEYYNLQGVKVDIENVQSGVYVKKQGSHTSKMFVK